MTLVARLDRIDRAISARLLMRPENGSGRMAMVAVRRISQTGSYGVGWVLLFAIVATWLEGWRVAAAAACCVLATLVLNTGVKLVVRRPRPGVRSFGDQPTTYSMPSAHTSMAIVGATAMTMIEPGLAALWWGWALVLAVSRVLLGMHYLGDVIAGAAFGILVACLAAVPVLHWAGA